MKGKYRKGNEQPELVTRNKSVAIHQRREVATNGKRNGVGLKKEFYCVDLCQE